MALENGNGNMVMPVAPMMGGYGGYGNWGMDGFGGSGWWVILFLFAMMGGGFGNWGNNGNNGVFPYLLNNSTQNDVNRGFDNAGLSNQISGVQAAVEGVNQNNQLQGINAAIRDGFASAEVANCNRAFSQMQTAYQNQISSMQNQFNLATAVDDRLDNIAMALQKCCCDNELAICGVNNNITSQAAENRFQAAQNTRDIITNATANTQSVLDKLCQLELDGIKSQLAASERENANLRTAAQLAAIQASQVSQTGQLMADNAAQTQYIVNRVAPYPTPSFQVGNPYGYYYNGYNTGCGCGCSGFANGVA